MMICGLISRKLVYNLREWGCGHLHSKAPWNESFIFLPRELLFVLLPIVPLFITVSIHLIGASVDIRHHGGLVLHLGDCACSIHLKGKDTHRIQPVPIVSQCLIHSVVSHKTPHHTALALLIIHQSASPPKNEQEKSACCQMPFIYII